MTIHAYKRVIPTGAGRFYSSFRSGEASDCEVADLFAIEFFLRDESLLDFRK